MRDVSSSVTHSAASLLAKDLFPSNPTIFVNKVDPVLEDLQADIMVRVRARINPLHAPQVIVPFSNVQ